jgi:two-component system CheB/CheR fusion protein
MVESAPNAVFLVDAAGRIRLVNAEAERLFGWPREELLGQPVELLLPEAARGRHAGQRAAFFAEPRPRHMGRGRDLTAMRRDGSTFPVEIGLTPVETPEGPAVLGAIIDISERKGLEEELQRRIEQLAEADRQKDRFLAMLGHELRNPLAPLRNAVQILGMPGLDQATLRDTRALMERQVEQLVRLVDDLLDVSQIVRGQLDLRLQVVDLAQVLDHAVETVQPVLRSRGHQLATTPSPEPLHARADLVRLSQAIANLLTNAAKYSPPGSSVRLSLERDGSCAVIRVSDEGEGMSPELLPRVFDVFVRGDSPAVRTQAGLGLGLALVKRTVELHGGSVSAHSDGPGLGSELVLRLPLCKETPAEAPTPKRRSAGSGRRVLVVDDNVDAVNSMVMLLRVQGHAVESAFDGRSALMAAEAFEPEVVLLDIGLPDMTGYDVARELRSRPRLREAALIAVTGYGQPADRRRSREAGIDHHLTKPVDPSWIGPAIETWTAGR